MIYQTNLKNYAIASVTIILSCLVSHSSFAYTLHDAIISAHENNYSIQSQQESLKATRMDLYKAYAGFLPQVSAQGQATKTKYKQYNYLNNNPNAATYNLQVNQPLFNGGQTVAQVKNVEHAIKAAEWQYKAVSNQLSVDVTATYMNVFYTLNNYQLNIHNEKLLTDTLEFVRAMFQAGQVTIT